MLLHCGRTRIRTHKTKTNRKTRQRGQNVYTQKKKRVIILRQVIHTMRHHRTPCKQSPPFIPFVLKERQIQKLKGNNGQFLAKKNKQRIRHCFLKNNLQGLLHLFRQVQIMSIQSAHIKKMHWTKTRRNDWENKSKKKKTSIENPIDQMGIITACAQVA